MTGLPSGRSSTPLPTSTPLRQAENRQTRSIATTGVDRPRSFRDDTPAFDKQSQVDPETQRRNTEVQRRHQRPERINRGQHNGRRELRLDRTQIGQSVSSTRALTR
jgi:hypothetical protein